jgi:hypothetical protein
MVHPSSALLYFLWDIVITIIIIIIITDTSLSLFDLKSFLLIGPTTMPKNTDIHIPTVLHPTAECAKYGKDTSVCASDNCGFYVWISSPLPVSN